MKKVVLGFLGTTLDRGDKDTRWEHWRPTVSIFQHEDLLVDRVELFYPPKAEKLFEIVAADIKMVSPETEVCGHSMHLRDPWDFQEVYSKLVEFADSYPFRPDKEEYLVHMTTGTHVAQICLFLLTESRYIPGKIFQVNPPRRRGQDKPGTYSVIDLDLAKYDRLAARFEQRVQDDISFLKSGIETRDKDFNTLIERIEQVAMSSDAPILLTGPTGAGKSQLARRIYELRKTRNLVHGNFIEANCATLRGDIAMSTLFGHKKGAFTGAVGERDGLLTAADGGILFLDEIGELGIDEQGMLLRAIEEKRFTPMGSDTEKRSDFQLICGTNRDLKANVADHMFRYDLLARINLWTFRLPGLRSRKEDIEPNLDYELSRFASNSGKRVQFNKEARSKFMRFATSPSATWTGNFRDLNAAITRMATLASGGRINELLVDEEIGRLEEAWTEAHDDPDDVLLMDVLGGEGFRSLDRFDRHQLAEVIRVCREAKTLSDAGRKLFQASRERKKQSNDADRLRKYLARFQLSWENVCD